MLYQFPIWIRSIHCLLQNHTVYFALKESMDVVPTLLADDVAFLIDQIEQDPTSFTGYQNLMQRNTHHEVHHLLRALHRYSALNKAHAQDELIDMMAHNGKWLHQLRRTQLKQSIQSYELLGLFPMGLTGLFLVAQMAGYVMSMMQGGF